ncbi:Ras-related protein Rab-31 [Tritrichomonas foetus]|uniref:Ras-related protein Rab-31 n=1 Tax=Tritrichomonas foetus TaxID=1144522 RepID=A0A1J4JQT3_9EUKA|nr:Ras-related protein Rab-31 [Tritrichomonas foetus]|eukprot:OHT01535.1 Ras-related protein Rab-31 [Tritrichomonas foetus]
MISRDAHIREFKIIILGDSGVGKTSIIQRYSLKQYNESNESTIGASFFTNRIDTPHGSALVSIWDTAGQEHYRSLIPTYSRGAHAALFCYDVTSNTSFASLDRWIDDIKNFAPEDISIFIAGTKCDLEPYVAPQKVNNWANSQHYPLFQTSAKRDVGITEMFECITMELLGKKFGSTETKGVGLIEVQHDRCC